MKLFLPKQHGAWAMLIIPFWLGVVASNFSWQHIPFFIGWLLLYLATYPLLLLFKRKRLGFYLKWTLIYLIPSLLLLLVPISSRPSIVIFGLLMVPFFLLNVYFSKKNNDRALLNDFCAILVFGLAGLASSYLPSGEINEQSILVFITSNIFFVGCTFYVKTMIREKNSLVYKRISWTYHMLIPIFWVFLDYWIIAFAFLPSLFRAVYFYGRPMSMKKIGVLEIVNAILFFVIMIVVIK